MEDNPDLIESLIQKATDYGKASFELVKLKALDKTTDLISSVVPLSLVIILIFSFFMFLNIGIALWLGDIMGGVSYGFFVLAGLYMFMGIIIHFFLNKWIKRVVGNYFIRRILKD
jgi:hypothetical protein